LAGMHGSWLGKELNRELNKAQTPMRRASPNPRKLTSNHHEDPAETG
jgi:hypothetical protein